MLEFLQQHASILLVILPLLSAPVTALLPRGNGAWFLTVLVTGASMLLAAYLSQSVVAGTAIHYELGGWAPPWGIAYEIDAMNALIALLVGMIGFLIAIYALNSVKRDIPEEKHSLFYSAYQLCFLGLLGMSMTGDLFNVFVFLEISSLSTYALVSMGKNRRALTAAFQYLILGTVGATFFLIGVGLAYVATGTLNMADLALRLPHSDNARTVETALGFIFIGMALKAAMFPLHQWLPSAYSYAPVMVSAFLAGTATKVAVYVVARTVFTIFSSAYTLATVFDELLLILGAGAVIYGALQAMRQNHIKPLLAWSSVSQIGYFMMGMGLLSSTGMMATLIHMFNHGLIKTALFMLAGILLYQTGSLNLNKLAGAGKRSVLVFWLMVIAGLSLIGVPGTVGFISKWYLVLAAIEQQMWWAVIVMLLGSVMAIVYVWKIVETLYFEHEGEAPLKVRSVRSASLFIPSLILVFACIYFGFNTSVTVGLADKAVSHFELLRLLGAAS